MNANKPHNVGAQNLAHVIEDNCHDPDCELHHPDVALEEEVCDLTDVAFFLAGAQTMRDTNDYEAIVRLVTKEL
jgi:hypothetical protein